MDLSKPVYLIIVDLETMGKKPGCIITEIGSVVVNMTEPGSIMFSFDQVLDYASSKRAGFKSEKKTIEFWAKLLELDPLDSKAANEKAFATKWMSTYSIKKSIKFFSAFYEQIVEAAGGKDQVYLVGNDIDFDKCILEHYYAAMNEPTPWHYRAWLSLPTLVWLTDFLTGVDVKKKVRLSWKTTHCAVDDARQEAAMVNTALDLVRPMRYSTDEQPNNPE